MALEAVATLPPDAHVDINPTKKLLLHARRSRGAKVTRGRRVTSLHGPRAHEQGRAGANWLVV